MKSNRSFSELGIRVSLASIPNETGIGNLGTTAKKVVDLAESVNLKYVQFDTTCESFSNWSVFAGNPVFIDLKPLSDAGLIKRSLYSTDFQIQTHMDLLKEAYGRAIRGGLLCSPNYIDFKKQNSYWIYNYGFFMAYRDAYKGKSVYDWDKSIRDRDLRFMDIVRTLLNDSIEFYMYIQYLYFSQLAELRKYANERRIKLIEFPIQPSEGTVDIWAHRKLFKVDDNLRNKGDLILFDFSSNFEIRLQWWIERIKHSVAVFDVVDMSILEPWGISSDSIYGCIFTSDVEEILKAAIPTAIFMECVQEAVTGDILNLFEKEEILDIHLIRCENKSEG